MKVHLALSISVLIAIEAYALPPLNCPAGSIEYQNAEVKGCLVRDGEEKYLEGPFYSLQKNTNRVAKSGTFKNGKIEGEVIEYYPSGQVMSKYQVKSDQMQGAFEKFYESGKKRSAGEMTNNSPSGKWQFWGEDGKLLAEGDYEKVSAAITKYDADAKSKRMAERDARDKEYKNEQAAKLKNWSAKKVAGVDAFYDAKNNLYWSGWIGQGRFVIAQQKCGSLGSGWRLPSRHEWSSSYESGMSSAVPEMGQVWWTSTNQAKETNPQMSLQLGDKSAWALNGTDGNFAPFPMREELSVRCVRK